MLPHIPPLNIDFLRKEFVSALQRKKIFLARLADAEGKYDELTKTLRTVISDAEIKELVQAHCSIEGPNNLETRYIHESDRKHGHRRILLITHDINLSEFFTDIDVSWHPYPLHQVQIHLLTRCSRF